MSRSTSLENIFVPRPRLSQGIIRPSTCTQYAQISRSPSKYPRTCRDDAKWHSSGSTIGNFEPSEAKAFLSLIADHGGWRWSSYRSGSQEDEAILAAITISRVTAAFNLNLLSRMKNELDAIVDIDAFAHDARYNAVDSRIKCIWLASPTRVLPLAGANSHSLLVKQFIPRTPINMRSRSFRHSAGPRGLSPALSGQIKMISSASIISKRLRTSPRGRS